jgi:uncharacterized protein (DUF885 family)
MAMINRNNMPHQLLALTIIAAQLLYIFRPGISEANSVSIASPASFTKFVDKYLDDFYRHHPTAASYDGVHTYDDTLEHLRANDGTDEMAMLKQLEQELAGIDPKQLNLSSRLDYQLVESNIQFRRLDLDRIRSWQKNPQIYSDIISDGLRWVALYEYDTAENRLRHIIAREREVVRLLDEAKANITNPPQVFIKVGLSSLRGTLSFVESDVPKAFASVKEPKLLADFKQSTAAAAALRSYIKCVETDLQPKAQGEFALGKQNFEDKLRHQEGIDIPLETLIAIAEREIKSNQEQFRAAAAKIAPDRSPLEVWNEIKHNHPPAGTLVSEVQKQLDTLIKFINEKRIVTIPKAPPVFVGPTPEFMRWGFGSMFNPGPFETKPLKSPYYITDVDPTWTPEQKEEHLTEFNHPKLWILSIHEAYPGHYVQQGPYLSLASSKVRKAFPFIAYSLNEGWAHYCEQMMVDEGFGTGDPKIRMAQIKEALTRLCRFYVGISLHTRGMTVEEGTKFFMNNAYMEELPARAEAERGTFDPTYLVYSVGKLEILKLRNDYKKVRGDKFTLQEFHNRLLANGNVPLWVHRQLLIPGDQGKLLDY